MQDSKQSKYTKLREEFPVFIFDSFSVKTIDDGYVFEFQFDIGNKYRFCPTHKLHLPKELQHDDLSADIIDALVFHIGMIELISYWKAACPPMIIIKPYCLGQDLLQWWKKLYYNGLGEFFFVNDIACNEDDFMEIHCESVREFPKFRLPSSESCIVPVGGGKDSAVSLELLKNKLRVYPMIINPRAATVNTVAQAGITENECIIVERSIDPLLLQLNQMGFLNGHTPFSALLAFESLLVSYLTGIPDVALSNESSANESTIPGLKVNHQYSKSIEFETDFRTYVEKRLCHNHNYFSFLRPLDELHIALLFSRLDEHHLSFRSCNAGSKTDIWCGKCSKCLFTWIILSPFIDEQKLGDIFGANLWEEKALIGDMEQLCGIQEHKPFECVGTREEVRSALDLALKRKKYSDLPVLLSHYFSKRMMLQEQGQSVTDLLRLTHAQHYLKTAYKEILLKELVKAQNEWNAKEKYL